MSFISDKIISEGLTFKYVLPLPVYSNLTNVNITQSNYFSINLLFNSSIDIAKIRAIPEAKMDIYLSSERVKSIINDITVPAKIDKTIVETAHDDSCRTVYVLKEVKNKIAETSIISVNNTNIFPHKHYTIKGDEWVINYNYSGALFTTRVISKVGVPQLSAIFDLSSALKEKNIPIIADGCIRYSGDIIKKISSRKGSIRANSIFVTPENAP